MYCIDITYLLDQIELYVNGNIESKIYKFNNSICHLKDNIYMMTYRLIFNDEYKHPWKLWNDSTNFKNPIQNTTYKYNYETISSYLSKDYFKYCRYKLNSKFVTNFSEKYEVNDMAVYDSTGLVIFKIKNPSNYEILFNTPTLFKNIWNHDTRIYNLDNKFYFVYNSFLMEGDKIRCAMLMSQFNIDLSSGDITIFDEKFINNKVKNNLVEKNWTLLNDKYIQYSIDGEHKIINNHTNKFEITQVPLIKYLKKLYKNKIYFSLSTPIQKINGKNIGIGHCKINFRHLYPNTNFQKFNDKYIKLNKNIKLHGHLIYFFYFYVFDDKHNVISISNAFIPSYFNNHDPYYLVFPIGFTKYKHDIFIISYGEGDARCKLMYIHKNKILATLQDIKTIDFDFELMLIN